jgi:hypothetical protein
VAGVSHLSLEDDPVHSNVNCPANCLLTNGEVRWSLKTDKRKSHNTNEEPKRLTWSWEERKYRRTYKKKRKKEKKRKVVELNINGEVELEI